MDLVRTDRETGAEHWLCPRCGRQLLLWWDPFRRKVLVPGDAAASHAASKGIQIGSPQAMPVPPPATPC